jgi:hypothetical protein
VQRYPTLSYGEADAMGSGLNPALSGFVALAFALAVKVVPMSVVAFAAVSQTS